MTNNFDVSSTECILTAARSAPTRQLRGNSGNVVITCHVRGTGTKSFHWTSTECPPDSG
jgi:hypothetical protein